MKRWLMLTGFLLVCLIAYNQTDVIIPESYAPGNASVARIGEWLPFQNPALLDGVNHPAISMVIENRFTVKELSTEAASLQIPFHSLKVGLAVSHFGFSTYSEMLVGIAAAHTFDKLLTIGIQVNYYNAYFSGEQGNKGTLLAHVGLLSQITPDFYIGFSSFNPTRQKVYYQLITKDIPSVFTLGSCYRFSNQLVWLTQLTKAVNADVQWGTGFEYNPTNVLAIRFGGYGAPFIPTLGAGVQLNQFRINVNFEKHPVLGITSVGGLQYLF